MADCGCKGPECRLQTPDQLIAFADAVRVLYNARMKKLGKCERCHQSEAVTALELCYLPSVWRDLVPGRAATEHIKLCGKCYTRAKRVGGLSDSHGVPVQETLI